MDDTTGRVTGAGGAYDDNPDIRTREIREEIAQTRVEMSETIEAIQERLTPGHLAAQAGETVRNAATEKVKQMAHTAEHAAEQIRESSFVETIRANPIPSAMIGIGAAWLMMKGRSQEHRSTRFGEYSRYRTGAGRDWRTGTGLSGSGMHTAVGTTGSTAGTSGYSGDTSGYAAGYTGESSRVPEFGGEMRSYGRDDLGYQGSQGYQGTQGYRGSQGSQQYGRRSSVNVERVVRENPIAIGAAAALVGVAIGLSLPSTDAENRVLGEARDSVMDRARDMASEAADTVKGAVGLDTGKPTSGSSNASGGSNAGGSNIGGSGIGGSSIGGSNIGGSTIGGSSAAGSDIVGSNTSESNTGESNTGGSTRGGSSRRGSNRSTLG